MRHMDLAVNRTFFPFVKTQFNPPGQRKFLYIGHTAHNKNVGYLSQLQQQCESADISWAGRGRKKIPGVHVLGFMDFSQPEARAKVAEFDFMITVGAMDANPTTILESMAWGLIPTVTMQSGYENRAGIVNVPLNDVAGRGARLQASCRPQTDAELLETQRLGQEAIDTHYRWDRFYADVRAAIDGTESPAIRAGDLEGTHPDEDLRPGSLMASNSSPITFFGYWSGQLPAVTELHFRSFLRHHPESRYELWLDEDARAAPSPRRSCSGSRRTRASRCARSR